MAKTVLPKTLSPQQAKKERKQWGIPDWKKPEEYEYVKSLKDDKLRWEFLRRDQSYRKRYKLSSTQSQPHILLGEWINPKKRADTLKKDFIFADTMRRGQPLRLTPPPILDLLFKEGEISPDWKIYARFGHQLTELIDAGYVILAFDPLRSPTKQLNSAQDFLNDKRNEIENELEQGDTEVENTKSKQKNKKRTRAITLKDPIKLLRVLDAYNEGISTKDIGIEIYGIHPDDYSDAAATGYQHLARARNYWRKL